MLQIGINNKVNIRKYVEAREQIVSVSYHMDSPSVFPCTKTLGWTYRMLQNPSTSGTPPLGPFATTLQTALHISGTSNGNAHANWPQACLKNGTSAGNLIEKYGTLVAAAPLFFFRTKPALWQISLCFRIGPRKASTSTGIWTSSPEKQRTESANGKNHRKQGKWTNIGISMEGSPKHRFFDPKHEV